MQETLIRYASIEDVVALTGLHFASFNEACWTSAQIKGSLILPTTRTWVAVREKAVGFLMSQICLGEAEILTFCVHPSVRQQGVGDQLIRQAFRDFAKEEPRISSIFLEVAADNQPAIALYEKVGFIKRGVRPNYYKHGEKTVDALNYCFKTTD